MEENLESKIKMNNSWNEVWQYLLEVCIKESEARAADKFKAWSGFCRFVICYNFDYTGCPMISVTCYLSSRKYSVFYPGLDSFKIVKELSFGHLVPSLFSEPSFTTFNSLCFNIKEVINHAVDEMFSYAALCLRYSFDQLFPSEIDSYIIDNEVFRRWVALSENVSDDNIMKIIETKDNIAINFLLKNEAIDKKVRLIIQIKAE